MDPGEPEEPGLLEATPADAEVRFQSGIRARRLEKLQALRDRGVEPYPVRFDRDATAAEIRDAHGDLPAGTVTGHAVALAGRLMGQRRHGALVFGDLRDETGAIQLMASRQRVGEQALEDFAELDLGDWIGVRGVVATSDRGELSVLLDGCELLSKSLRALPSVRHGLTDPDARYRRRYLDLTLSEQTRRTFAIRSSVIATIRRVLTERGFREVETPVLLGQAGGAAARPFITHHNALDIEMTLRIALELPLKRLIVGGMDRVFEIGRVFRNEGLDTRHNPEFTLLEAYQAFGDYHDMMDLTEALVVTAAEEAIGTTVVTVGDREVDLKPPWRRVTMVDLIREHAGVDMHPSMPLAEARRIADDLRVHWLRAWGAGKIMSEVYDATCEDELIEPTFVLDHPREISPLARAHRDDPALTERFELVVAGRELANAYSELNDPVDQAERFQAEAELQAGGDDEAEPVDDDYVEALEYGLPPTGGLGIGLDRLVMLIAKQEAIREVILFPTLRPEGSGGADDADVVSTERAPSAADVAALSGETVGGGDIAALPPALTGRPRSLRPLAWASVITAIFSLLPTATGWRFSIARFGFVSHSDRSVGLIAVGGDRDPADRHRPRPGPRQAARLGDEHRAVRCRRRGPRAAGPRPARGPAVGRDGDRARLVPPGFPRPGRSRVARAGAGVRAAVPDRGAGGVHGGDDRRTPPHRPRPHLRRDRPYHLRRAGRHRRPVHVPSAGVPGVHRRRASDAGGARDSDLPVPDPPDVRAIAAADPGAARASGADRAHVGRRHPRLLRVAPRQELLLLQRRALAGGLSLRPRDRDGGRRPDRAAQDTARTLDEFLHFCAGRGWRVGFFAVREADADLYRARNMRVIYLGDEAIVSCQDFTLDRPELKEVRGVVRRLDRDHTFELIAESEADPALVSELNEISAEWREGAPERGFTMELGQDVEGEQSDFVIALARTGGGRVAGFLRFVPVYGPHPGYSLDLMRRRPDSTNGVTEYLIARAALGLGARGFQSLSLNFAAWGRLLDSAENAGLSGRMQRLMARGLNPFFQIQSLRDFNQKFDPRWVPRSVVIDDVSDLPRIALLYASVEGFLDVPLVGRLFEPPLRQRVDAGGPDGAEAPEVTARR